MHRIFVYGTLMQGHANHDAGLLGPCFVARCRTALAYPLIITAPWRSPALLAEPNSGHRVWGELYDVDDGLLDLLDRMESTHLPTGYDRIHLEIVDQNGREIAPAWAYVKERSRVEAILEGPLEEYAVDPAYVTVSNRS